MNRLTVPLLVCACVVPAAGGCASGGQSGPASATPVTTPVVLLPGDRLGVQVQRNQELSGTFTVTRDSTLNHPLYAEVKVAGVPMSEVRSRMQTFLRRFEADPKFILDPLFRVYVGGQVRDQNQQYLPEISIGQAITQAGGSTAPNRRYRVRLIRQGQQVVVPLNSPAAAALLQEPVRSGDQILVEERPTFNRTYLQPALQVLQTVTTLISTYVFLEAIFGSDDESNGNGTES